jgi:hypothetical protein
VYTTTGNDFEHLANTGVNTPGRMFQDSVPRMFDFPDAAFGTASESALGDYNERLSQLLSLAADFRVMIMSFIIRYLSRQAQNGF